MDFGSALEALKSGAQVYRIGWGNQRCLTVNNNGIFIGDKIALPVDFSMPWRPSNDDLLCNDWELV